MYIHPLWLFPKDTVLEETLGQGLKHSAKLFSHNVYHFTIPRCSINVRILLIFLQYWIYRDQIAKRYFALIWNELLSREAGFLFLASLSFMALLLWTACSHYLPFFLIGMFCSYLFPRAFPITAILLSNFYVYLNIFQNCLLLLFL